MYDKPWIERVFGKSWQTTVTGFGGAFLAIIFFWLGIKYESKDLLGAGATIIGVAVAALGALSRSNAASEEDHQKDREKMAQTSMEVERAKLDKL